MWINIHVIIGVLVVLSGLAGCTEKNAQAQPVKTGAGRPANAIKAPDFTLLDVDGKPFTLSSLQGKVVLLNFWATWCAPCRREIPDFIKLYQAYNQEGIEIVGVTLPPRDPASIRKFIKQIGINYTILTGTSDQEMQNLAGIFGKAIGEPITGIPTTFLVDQEGYIRKSYLGPRSGAVFYEDIKRIQY